MIFGRQRRFLEKRGRARIKEEVDVFERVIKRKAKKDGV